MTVDRLLRVGDVFTCKRLEYCQVDSAVFTGTLGPDAPLCVSDGTEAKYLITSRSEDERLAIAAKEGRIPARDLRHNISRIDPTRATAEFIVDYACMSGGSSGYDAYPDGWNVIAIRLNNQDERVQFYQSGCFIQMVRPEEIDYVRTMKKRINVAFE